VAKVSKPTIRRTIGGTAIGSKLEAGAVPIPDSLFDKSAQKLNIKQDTEQIEAAARKMRDRQECLEYLDAQPQSGPIAAPTPVAKRGRGRLGSKQWGKARTRYLLAEGIVVATLDGLGDFAKALANEWNNGARGSLPKVKWTTLRNTASPIWNEYLGAEYLRRTSCSRK
jgi:hypothetical protein